MNVAEEAVLRANKGIDIIKGLPIDMRILLIAFLKLVEPTATTESITSGVTSLAQLSTEMHAILQNELPMLNLSKEAFSHWSGEEQRKRHRVWTYPEVYEMADKLAQVGVILTWSSTGSAST